jgi:predicted alpha/beta hydrolase family esterase
MKKVANIVLKRAALGAALGLAPLLGLGGMAWAQGSGASEDLVESLHRVRLPRGAEITALVSQRMGTKPTTAALLFAGYPGILRLREENGAIVNDMNGNFLIRARRWLNTAQVFTVAVDCPSDQLSVCDDHYRTSAQHAEDIAALAASIKTAFAAEKIYLVGTSYGTLSTSFLARALAGQVDGAAHTATMTDPSRGRNAHGVPLGSFDWSKTQMPQLFIHHKDDPCSVARYASVQVRHKEVPLITVQGADNPRGHPCEARSQHGFTGRERATMAALHDWITDRKLSEIVDAE